MRKFTQARLGYSLLGIDEPVRDPHADVVGGPMTATDGNTALALPPEHADLPHLTFQLTPTQKAFVLCEKSYPVLIGGEGEGKTFCAIAAIFAHHQRCKDTLIVPSTGKPRDMMGLIIRDTLVNLKRHTVRSIERVCGDYVCMKEYHGIFALKAEGITCDLMGMDNIAAAARIQGGEYDFIWLEEPAPIVHTGNGGIDVSVWQQVQRRIRGGLTPKRAQVTMNPSSNDHWTYRHFIQLPDPDMRVFRMKKGENPFLSDADRTRRARAFLNRPDLAKRYDEGEFGAVFAGVAITPEFSELLHVFKDPNDPWLRPIPGLETIRMYDGGLNPSCAILQITPSGHLHFLDCIVGENMGMRQMIRTRLKKVLARPRYEKCFRWRDIGDPALDTREQSDSDQRASLVIQEELSQPGRPVYFEPGVSDWNTRREGLKEMFSRNIDGRPMVQINPRPTEGEPCNALLMGFGGGYQYAVNAAGIVSRDGPLKNLWSHPLDAISHSIPLLLFPTQMPLDLKERNREIRQRAAGYCVK